VSVVLIEAGLFALLDSPIGQVSRYVTFKAEQVEILARENVRNNFRSRTGNLEQSIGTFPTETPDGLEVEIGTDGAPYGRILELGGEEHLILPVTRDRLFSRPENPDPLNNPQSVVLHPGPPAKPWLRPALETVFNG
jgi:hypothetical protein